MLSQTVTVTTAAGADRISAIIQRTPRIRRVRPTVHKPRDLRGRTITANLGNTFIDIKTHLVKCLRVHLRFRSLHIRF